MTCPPIAEALGRVPFVEAYRLMAVSRGAAHDAGLDRPSAGRRA